MLTFHPDVKVLQTLEAQPGWRVLSAWDWWPTADLGTKLDGVEQDVEFRDEPLIFWLTVRTDRRDEPGIRYGGVSVAPVTVNAEGDVNTLYAMTPKYVLVREGADLAAPKRVLLERLRRNRERVAAKKQAGINAQAVK